MPVPSSINDLSTTAGSNSPPGNESPATLDDYQRAHASFIAQLRNVSGLGAVAGQFLAFSASNTASLRAIVGTVAQSLGIPTGALAEFGSTATGVYFRFVGGLQVCISSDYSIVISTAAGAIFRAATPPTWTFPAAFAAEPIVISIPKANSFTWGAGYSAATTTTALLPGFSVSSLAAIFIYGVAIGRWHT